MKKLLSIFLFLFTVSVSAQQFTTTQSMGTPKTIVKSNGGLGADSGYVIPGFADTTAANRGKLDEQPGLLIRAGNTLWLRNATATGWVNIGEGADSTLFATLYRLDTMRTNLYQRLGLKLNISDTASMLTNYVRAKRLSDTASAIRSAFPKFGTSTDDIATGARSFDANGNQFIITNAGEYSGFFSSGSYSLIGFLNSPGASFGPAPYMFFGKNSGLNPYATVQLSAAEEQMPYASINTSTGDGKQASINVHSDATKEGMIDINTYEGRIAVYNLQSSSSTDSIVMVNPFTSRLYRKSPSALLTSAGGVPTSRTLTINGTSYDLSANRSWTINGDFYTIDGTFSSNRRANLDGYRLTYDSGQVRYRDTMTSSTGKLYGMISDYGRAGIEHINYDSLTTAYHSVNTVTGVKFGVKDQNNLDTNNYIQADASGAYAVTGAVSTSDSSNKIATTKWVKQQLYGSGGSSDGNNYLTSVTYEQDIRTMNFSRSGLADLTVQLPLANSSDPGLMSEADKKRLDSNSYLLNPIHPDSLLFQKNDTVMVAKAVTVESQIPDITINTDRTDTTLKHQLIKLNISEPIISFTAGAGFAADTTVFTDSTLYGSFYTGQDSFYVTKAFAVLKGQSGDTLGIQIVYNDTFNVTGTVVGGGTLAVNNRTTGNSFDISTNSGIPPNMWVWLKSPTVVAGKKPEYLSVTLIGYRRYVAP